MWARHAKLSLGLLSCLWLASCGGQGLFREITCQTEDCFVSAESGHVEMSIENLKPDADYFVWIISDKVVSKKNQSKGLISLSSSLPSAPLSLQEERARTQVKLRPRGLQSIAPNLQNIIGTPQPSFFAESFTALDIYVAEPQDYWTRLIPTHDQTVGITVPVPSDIRLSGRRVSFESLKMGGADYELFVDTSQYGNADQFKQKKLDYIQSLSSCLNRVFPNLISALGRPLYDLDGDPKLRILFTEFARGLNSQTVGLFSQRDRFESVNGQPLSDGNRGEYIYISPNVSPSFACATVAHEYHHLVTFDYKTLSVLSDKERGNFEVLLDLNTPVERLSFSEAAAHSLEMATGEETRIYDFIQRLLGSPSESTLSLELSFGDFLQNSRTRGLATLIYLFALRKAESTLNLDNPLTQHVIRSFQSSPKTGVDSLAAHFNMSTDLLMKDFLSSFSKALLYGSLDAQFLPPREMNSSRTRGFEILPISDSLNDQLNDLTSIHPLEIEIPLIASRQNHYVFPQTLLVYRLRTPSEGPSHLRLTVEANENPLFVGFFPAKK